MVSSSRSIGDKEAESALNESSFIIDTMVNRIYSVPTLINNECKCLAAVSNSLVQRADLARINITLCKLIETLTGTNKGCMEMLYQCCLMILY